MKKEEILKAAEYCLEEEGDSCQGCTLIEHGGGCTGIFAKYILEKEKEPAPPESDTSSKVSEDTANLHFNNNAKTKKSQAFDFCDRAVANILRIYENMTKTEQTAFDLGEVYRDMLSARNETEDMKLKEEIKL